MTCSGPRFTVIMPTRNYGRFLRRAVDSVLGQEGADFELRVIDDGSTDDTADIAATYGDDIVYERQAQAGPFRACRRGVEQTPPDRYVLFLDADDRLRPGFLRAMAEPLRHFPETGMLFGTVINVTAEGRERPGPAPAVSADPLTNFDRFIQGRLELSAGGAVFARWVLAPLAEVLDRFGSFHGLDRVLVAQGLARGPCRVVPEAEVEIHDHAQRLRDDVDSFCATGLTAVDALFRSDLLPNAALPYRRRFLGRVLLEQARLLYRYQRWPEAASRYRRALRSDPAGMLRLRHLRRMLLSNLRAGLPSAGGRERAFGGTEPVGHAQPVEESIYDDG